jgi:hypothetical protein
MASSGVRARSAIPSLALIVSALIGVGACTAGSDAQAASTTKQSATKKNATKKNATKANNTNSATPSVAGVRIAFDQPGDSPRPLRETTVTIAQPTSSLSMEITAVSYPGVLCGFSFRGSRPISPVTIRLQGRSDTVSIDSGELEVAWAASGERAESAGSSTDRGSGWNFLADAVPNRTGPGWVVQIAGVPQDKKIPTAMRCSLTSSKPLTKANGPVGYWAGFATV